MGCHPSHWRSHIFQGGYCTTNQIIIPRPTTRADCFVGLEGIGIKKISGPQWLVRSVHDFLSWSLSQSIHRTTLSYAFQIWMLQYQNIFFKCIQKALFDFMEGETHGFPFRSQKTIPGPIHKSHPGHRRYPHTRCQVQLLRDGAGWPVDPCSWFRVRETEVRVRQWMKCRSCG